MLLYLENNYRPKSESYDFNMFILSVTVYIVKKRSPLEDIYVKTKRIFISMVNWKSLGF